MRIKKASRKKCQDDDLNGDGGEILLTATTPTNDNDDNRNYTPDSTPKLSNSADITVVAGSGGTSHQSNSLRHDHSYTDDEEEDDERFIYHDDDDDDDGDYDVNVNHSMDGGVELNPVMEDLFGIKFLPFDSRMTSVSDEEEFVDCDLIPRPSSSPPPPPRLQTATSKIRYLSQSLEEEDARLKQKMKKKNFSKKQQSSRMNATLSSSLTNKQTSSTTITNVNAKNDRHTTRRGKKIRGGTKKALGNLRRSLRGGAVVDTGISDGGEKNRKHRRQRRQRRNAKNNQSSTTATATATTTTTPPPPRIPTTTTSTSAATTIHLLQTIQNQLQQITTSKSKVKFLNSALKTVNSESKRAIAAFQRSNNRVNKTTKTLMELSIKFDLASKSLEKEKIVLEDNLKLLGKMDLVRKVVEEEANMLERGLMLMEQERDDGEDNDIEVDEEAEEDEEDSNFLYNLSGGGTMMISNLLLNGTGSIDQPPPTTTLPPLPHLSNSPRSRSGTGTDLSFATAEEIIPYNNSSNSTRWIEKHHRDDSSSPARSVSVNSNISFPESDVAGDVSCGKGRRRQSQRNQTNRNERSSRLGCIATPSTTITTVPSGQHEEEGVVGKDLPPVAIHVQTTTSSSITSSTPSMPSTPPPSAPLSSLPSLIRIHDLNLGDYAHCSSLLLTSSSGLSSVQQEQPKDGKNNEDEDSEKQYYTTRSDLFSLNRILDRQIVFHALKCRALQCVADGGSRWTPDRNTERILSRRITKNDDTKVQKTIIHYAEPGKDPFIWFGKLNDTLSSEGISSDTYGSDFTAIKARGVVEASPREILDLLLDSTKAKDYNKMSLGRTDEYVFPQYCESDNGSVELVLEEIEERPPLLKKQGEKDEYSLSTKITRGLTSISLLRMKLEMFNLMHCVMLKKDVDGMDGYIIVTRSVWETEDDAPGGKNENSSSSSGNNEFTRSEMLLGVNLIREIPRDSDECAGNGSDEPVPEGERKIISEFSTVTHFHTPGMPTIGARQFAMKAASNFIRSIREQFV